MVAWWGITPIQRHGKAGASTLDASENDADRGPGILALRESCPVDLPPPSPVIMIPLNGKARASRFDASENDADRGPWILALRESCPVDLPPPSPVSYDTTQREGEGLKVRRQ